MAANRHPRRPAHLELAGGKSRRQRVWEAVRALREDFSRYQLARKAGVDDETVDEYLRALLRGGFVACLTAADCPIGTERRYRLLRDNGIEAPRLTRDGQPVTQGLGTEAMWRAMRIVGEFSARELAAHASASGVAVSEQTARTYVRLLCLAGYVLLAVPARTIGIGMGRTQARYRLAPGKYTGPRPPMVQRSKALYDPNLGQVVWQQEGDDDDC